MMPRMSKLIFLPLLAILLMSACQSGGGNIAHQRSIAELNLKAQELMQAGDAKGAVARLESALDLEPNNTQTQHNLAIAYQNAGDYDRAVAMFTQLKDAPGVDKPEMLKSLGIAYEAKADTLWGKAQENEKEKQPLEQEAGQYYQLALDSYQQSLDGLKHPEEVQAQIQALQEKLKNPQQ